MPKSPSVYFFDTVTLSNFAFAQRLNLLAKRYGKHLHVTQEVLNEVTKGIVCGYAALADIEAACLSGTFTISSPMSAEERKIYRRWLGVLASGEASCIAAAKGRKAIVATDDREARTCCMEQGILITGTIGILKACCLDHMLSPQDADEILNAMIAAGYHSPVLSISGLL